MRIELRQTALPSIIALSVLASAGIAPVALGGSTGLAAGALAPSQDSSGLMTVISDGATVRCGDKDIFYAVAQIDKGTVLQSAGTSGDYTMVVVPRRIGAFVPAAEVNSGDGTVTLKVDSRLRAPSQLLGLSGSWKQMYANPLSAGTELQVIEALKNEAGTIVGYRVVAPTGSGGELPVVFVRSDTLRPSLDTEAKAFLESQGMPVTKTGTNPAPKPAVTTGQTKDSTQSEPAPKPQTQTPAPTQPATPAPGTDERVDSSLLDEMNLPGESGDAPVEISNAAPVSDAGSPAPAPRRAEDGRISASKLEDLEAAFTRARQLPRKELDEALGELLAEFTRTRGDAEDDSSLARALDQRIEWINLRIATRDQRREIARALAQSDQRADELSKSIESWQQGRAYQLVGRMVTSSVYTGKNLPLLYRIQGIDPITGQPHTIGYVAPGKDQDLRHLLGRVVGVIGTRTEDASLRMTVVEPERVDPMPESQPAQQPE